MWRSSGLNEARRGGKTLWNSRSNASLFLVLGARQCTSTKENCFIVHNLPMWGPGDSLNKDESGHHSSEDRYEGATVKVSRSSRRAFGGRSGGGGARACGSGATSGDARRRGWRWHSTSRSRGKGEGEWNRPSCWGSRRDWDTDWHNIFKTHCECRGKIDLPARHWPDWSWRAACISAAVQCASKQPRVSAWSWADWQIHGISVLLQS